MYDKIRDGINKLIAILIIGCFALLLAVGFVKLVQTLYTITIG